MFGSKLVDCLGRIRRYTEVVESALALRENHRGQACGGRVPSWRPGEATGWSGENEAKIALETRRCLRCQSHEIAPNKSYRPDVKTALERGICMCGLQMDGVEDMGHRDKEFGVCPAGFHFRFGPVFHCCGLFLPLWMVMFMLYHCILELCSLLFDFYRGIPLKNCLGSQKRCWILKQYCNCKRLGNFWGWTKCIVIWPRAYKSHAVECGGLNENGYYKLTYLNGWFPFDELFRKD